MHKHIILSILILFVSYPAEGQFINSVSKTGTTAAPFLEIGVGSRAVSMGGAFVSMAKDATALYWNPAGLSRIRENQAAFNQTNWLADISHSFAGTVIQIGNDVAVGGSVTAVTMDEMAVRTIEKPEGTGELFNVSNLAIALSGARNLTDKVSIGFTGKYIQEQIWHMQATSFALDIGTLFQTGYRGLSLGMAITNFGNKMQLSGRDTQVQHDIDPVHAGNNSKINAHLDTREWSLPLNFQVGVSMNLFETRWAKFTVAADAMHPNNNTESINLGGEFAINDMIYLRGGYRNMFLEDSEEGPTLGAGLRFVVSNRLVFYGDYAYADFGILNNVQRFSLALGF